ncbi:hypothetical protein ABBQ32_001417 [Trebouxia sp. C0010 RCD-2024]
MSGEYRARECKANIVIVPTTSSYELELEPQRERTQRKRSSQSARKAVTREVSSSPKNYLMAGGYRAANRDRDEQLLQLNRAAMKDLRNANSALANELARTRSACQEDLDSMRQDLATYASDLKTEQDHAATVRQQLAATSAALQHAEKHHHSRAKELQKRLRGEHTLRARSESALEAVTLEAAAYKDKLQEATAGQAEAARLAVDLDVERNLHKETKSHVATLESRLQQEVSSREQLWSKNSEMDARLSKVVERNEHLMDELRAKEAAAANANGRLAQLEPQMEKLQQHSEALKAEVQSTKSNNSSLSQQVADLEAAAAMHLAHQADWERTRKDLDKARHDVERFRRALDKAAVEKRDLQQKVAATQQALQEAEAGLESAQAELAETRQQGDSELTRLGSEWDNTKQSLEDLEGMHRNLKEMLIRSKQENSDLRAEVETLPRLKDRLRTLQLQLKDAGETREAFAALKAQFIAHHDMLEAKERDLVRQDGKVQELAEMLREVRQRLTDGERSWESEKRGLEGQLNRNLHSLHECQATADQLREQVESLERSKASLSSKLAATQEEAAHAKTELAEQSSQAAKLKAQLSSITEAHSKFYAQDRPGLKCLLALPRPLLFCAGLIGLSQREA